MATSDIIFTADETGAQTYTYEWYRRNGTDPVLSSYFGGTFRQADYICAMPYDWNGSSAGTILVSPNGSSYAARGGATVGAYATSTAAVDAVTPGLAMFVNTRCVNLVKWPELAYSVTRGFRRIRMTGKFRFKNGPGTNKAVAALGWNLKPTSGTVSSTPYSEAVNTYGAPYCVGLRGYVIEMRKGGVVSLNCWDGTTETGETNYHNLGDGTSAHMSATLWNYFELVIAYKREGSVSPAWRNIIGARSLRIGPTSSLGASHEVTGLFGTISPFIDFVKEQWVLGAGGAAGSWGFGGRNQTDPWGGTAWKGFEWGEVKVEAADQNNEDDTNPTYETGTTIWRDTFDRDGSKFASRRVASGGTAGAANGVAVVGSLWATGEPRGSARDYISSTAIPKGGRGRIVTTTWTAGGSKTGLVEEIPLVASATTLPDIGPFGALTGYPLDGTLIQAPAYNEPMSGLITANTVKWDTTSTTQTLQYRDLYLIKTGSITKDGSAINHSVAASIQFYHSYNNKRPPLHGSVTAQDQTGMGLLLRMADSVGSGGKYSILDSPTTSKFSGYFGFVFTGDATPNVTVNTTTDPTYVPRAKWVIGRWNDGVEYILAAGTNTLFPPTRIYGNTVWELSFAVEDLWLELRLNRGHAKPVTLGKVRDDTATFDGTQIDPSTNNQLTGIMCYLSPNFSNGTSAAVSSKDIDCAFLLRWFNLDHAKIETPGGGHTPESEGWGFSEPPMTHRDTGLGAGFAPFYPAQSERVTVEHTQYRFLTDAGTERRTPSYAEGAFMGRNIMDITWILPDDDAHSLLRFLSGCRDWGKSFKIPNSLALSTSAGAKYSFIDSAAQIPFDRGVGAVFTVGPVRLQQSFV